MTTRHWKLHDEWWDLADSNGDPERERQLELDQREVTEEMIHQEFQSGQNRVAIATAFGMHHSTVWRITEKKDKEAQC